MLYAPCSLICCSACSRYCGLSWVMTMTETRGLVAPSACAGVTPACSAAPTRAMNATVASALKAAIVGLGLLGGVRGQRNNVCCAVLCSCALKGLWCRRWATTTRTHTHTDSHTKAPVAFAKADWRDVVRGWKKVNEEMEHNA